MLTIVHKLLDFIFPPRDTQLVVRGLSLETILTLYHPGLHETTHYLLPYQTDVVRSLIKENKFHGNTHAATLLAGILDRYLKEYVNQSVVVIPIPLSKLRKKTRGYNQVEQILQQLPPQTGVSIRADILSRAKDTPAQTTQPKEARLKNMKNAFVANAPKDITERCTVIIIDDVVTTGATLRAAREAITPTLPSSTTIICLALAH